MPFTPFLLGIQLNSPEAKYVMIVVAAPLWWPFVKAIWRELNAMLAEEGGLMGRAPTEEELAEIRRARLSSEDTMVSVLRDQGGPVPLSGRGRRQASLAGRNKVLGSSSGSPPGRHPAHKGFGTPRS